MFWLALVKNMSAKSMLMRLHKDNPDGQILALFLRKKVQETHNRIPKTGSRETRDGFAFVKLFLLKETFSHRKKSFLIVDIFHFLLNSLVVEGGQVELCSPVEMHGVYIVHKCRLSIASCFAYFFQPKWGPKGHTSESIGVA